MNLPKVETVSGLLPQILPLLACPVCDAAFSDESASVRCASGHVFDVARQGYLNLLAGTRAPHSGDTAAMLAERDAVLSSGLYEPVAEAVARTVADTIGDSEGAVLDIGAGTGYYLAAALERLPLAFGLALDVSKYAARRAAKAHPRASAVVCDVWEKIPVRTASVDAMLNVFSPRNVAEMARVSRQGAALVVVTPAAGHLRELVEDLGLLRVPENKLATVTESLGPYFERTGSELVLKTLHLTVEQAGSVAMMGPSAFHADAQAAVRRIHYHNDAVSVTLSVEVGVFRRTSER